MAEEGRKPVDDRGYAELLAELKATAGSQNYHMRKRDYPRLLPYGNRDRYGRTLHRPEHDISERLEKIIESGKE